jgi:hypothetical protein
VEQLKNVVTQGLHGFAVLTQFGFGFFMKVQRLAGVQERKNL